MAGRLEGHESPVMLKLVDHIPTFILLPLAVILLLAPFRPQPHVLEKLTMLTAGRLTRPLDIFDLVFHLLPAMLLLIKFMRRRKE
jgi:hypothetical protein